MMFKAAISVIAALFLTAAALYWRNDHLSDKLAESEISLLNARADLALTRIAITAQTAHTARNSAIAEEQSRIEDSINQTEVANAPADPATVEFVRSIGLLTD